MADQTHGAVDSLVGLLSTAIKDEAKLLGGIQGDMQFIKDEMESMNGFLLHLNKTKGYHDDQLRAWMKQVRDIAYIAQDCIHLYMRDFAPPTDSGRWGFLRQLPVLLWTMPARHRLATRVRELKVRVRDVGERRQRYDVTIPHPANLKQSPDAGQRSSKADVNKARDAFLRDLALDKLQDPPSFEGAIKLLPSDDLASQARKIRDNLKAWSPDDPDDDATHTRTICMEMLLRAFRAYRHGRRPTDAYLEKLLKPADVGEDLPKEVMIFCYSRLSTHEKSCLQYLSAFQKEKKIRRTSLVRRWVAEGLVDRQGNDQTPEEAAEHCFSELVFRGFLLPYETGASGKVKSCLVDKTVWGFVLDISKSENFVSNLPTNLGKQLHIRNLVERQEKRVTQQQQQKTRKDPSGSGGPRSMCESLCVPTKQPRDDIAAAAGGEEDPMDEMVKFLKDLPLTYYRLNVLDLGGCRGLKNSHLKSICKVLWLKYLCLRNTDVSRLPKQINKLTLLETLDVRQTKVRLTDTKHIFLKNLKHLLAGGGAEWAVEGAIKGDVPRMPRRIGTMTNMEILSHVQVSRGDDELENVSRLKRLRKLGVVLQGSEDNIKHLLRATSMLSESYSLRSLSIWISQPNNGGQTVELKMEEPVSRVPISLESLEIKGLGNTVTVQLPPWIHNLKKLSKITLGSLGQTPLSTNALQELGRELHGLSCLRLRQGSCSEPKLAFDKDGFRALKFLVVEDTMITSIAFEEDGAAPMLEKIVWRRSSSTVDMEMTDDTLPGFRRLTRLESVIINGRSQFIPSNTIAVEQPDDIVRE